MDPMLDLPDPARRTFRPPFPFHANLAVGADSWALYHFTDSPPRRKGSMTARQKRREKEFWPAETAAMRAGWTAGPWTWRRVMGRRLFPSKIGLPREWMTLYRRGLRTLALGPGQRIHACRYAF